MNRWWAPGWWRSARRQQAQPLEAATDPISGLPTRQVFEDEVDEALLRCEREGRSLALLYLGLDSFTLVNEAYGHAVGDAVLAGVPERLCDAVSQRVAAARIGGDEFVVALYGDAAEARRCAARVLAELRRLFRIDGHDFAIDASVGIAWFPQHGHRARLVVQAAAAMRAVKRNGGAAFAVFEPSMGVDMRQQVELLHDLRQAIARRELQLAYQPKIDAGTLQVTAAEALLRWHDARRGLVEPSIFIPLAEKHGLIAELGAWVIEEACAQAARWRDQGLHMRVAINVSGAQFRHGDWVSHLCGCLQRHGIQPARFTCEITETVAMEDRRTTREAFEQLRHAGVHVSIDDFGTGHSSLATLRTLPAAELKIDRSFVADLATSAEARAIVGSIVRMAHQLGLRVVAEGVETEAQRDLLVKTRCDELQGWLFARPMSAAALGVWASGAEGPSALSFRESLFRDSEPQSIGQAVIVRR